MLVDDHKMVREGIKRILEESESVKVVGEVGNGKECLVRMQSKARRPDVILLDMNMPEMSGLETLAELKKKRFKTKIMVLTGTCDIDNLIEAVDLGVDGYVLKSSDSKELIRALTYVSSGHKFIQPSLIPILNSRLIARDLENQKQDKLSDREIEVLKLVAIGMFNKEIGEKLGISERTVKNHMSSIFKKIECTDRTQAAVFAIRNGLVNIQ